MGLQGFDGLVAGISMEWQICRSIAFDIIIEYRFRILLPTAPFEVFSDHTNSMSFGFSRH